MGHSLGSAVISADYAATIRVRHPHDFTAAMVRAGVAQWRAEDAGRWDDENAGEGVLAPLTCPETCARYLEQHVEQAHRDSLVIPVCSPEDVQVTRKQMRLPVTAEQLRGLQVSDGKVTPYSDIFESIDHTLVDARVVKMPALRKPRARATEGTARTVYSVVERTSPFAVQTRGVFDSQAEARAVALELMERNTRIRRLGVQAVVVRDEGERDLVVIERPVPENAEVTFELTFHTPKLGATAACHQVYFDYHH